MVKFKSELYVQKNSYKVLKVYKLSRLCLRLVSQTRSDTYVCMHKYIIWYMCLCVHLYVGAILN